MRHRCLLLALGLAVSAARLDAQALSGLVRLAPSGTAAAHTLVLAVGDGARIVASARTDAGGVFALRFETPGAYRLLFVRGHDAPVLTPAFGIDSTDVEREFQIPGDPAVADTIFLAQEVSTPATFGPKGLPAPRYPDAEARQGVRGRVRALVVVDSAGRPEERTVTFVGATGERFMEPVQRAILAARFVPARHGARAVAQVVQLTYDFGCPGDTPSGDVIVMTMYGACQAAR